MRNSIVKQYGLAEPIGLLLGIYYMQTTQQNNMHFSVPQEQSKYDLKRG